MSAFTVRLVADGLRTQLQACDAAARRAVNALTEAGVHACELRTAGPDDPGVRAGTMHSLKGLEFRCVAVIGVNDGAVPYARGITPEEVDPLQHEADLMAERCLLFVACTRARDHLHVSWSGQPSRSLTEAGIG